MSCNMFPALCPADAHLLENMPQQRPPLTQLLSEVMALVLADLQAAGAQPDEQLLMGMARVAGIMGDPDKVCLPRGVCIGTGLLIVAFL